MKNRHDYRGNVLSRLSRIESKCDFIISEMIAQRRQNHQAGAVDEAIDRLHEAATSLRKQSEAERIFLRNRFGL